MLERLGLVCYWVGSALALLLFVGGIFAAISESNGYTNKLTDFLFFSGAAFLSWLIGRAIKFILSGK